MIQFNLLPDVKIEYIKAQRLKRTVVLSSFMVGASALALFVMFFMIVNVFQKVHLNNLESDIKANKKTLQDKPDLSKILTIQNQLNSLPELHKSNPVASRVFGFIQQVTPQKASVATLTINFADQTMTITGSAESLTIVNTYVDTLKFTNFTYDMPGENGAAGTPTTGPAFNSVVLSQFSVAGKDDKVGSSTYNITLKFDPIIFSSAQDTKLVVASKVTTRSETEKPATIFQSPEPQVDGGTE